jgi:hypothetical protein
MTPCPPRCSLRLSLKVSANGLSSSKLDHDFAEFDLRPALSRHAGDVRLCFLWCTGQEAVQQPRLRLSDNEPLEVQMCAARCR